MAAGCLLTGSLGCRSARVALNRSGLQAPATIDDHSARDRTRTAENHAALVLIPLLSDLIRQKAVTRFLLGIPLAQSGRGAQAT